MFVPNGVRLAFASFNNSLALIRLVSGGNSKIFGLPTNPETATVEPISFTCIRLDAVISGSLKSLASLRKLYRSILNLS